MTIKAINRKLKELGLSFKSLSTKEVDKYAIYKDKKEIGHMTRSHKFFGLWFVHIGPNHIATSRRFELAQEEVIKHFLI